MPYCQAGEGLCAYGVCPTGHYCELGTSDPEVCPSGMRYVCMQLALFTETTFILNVGATEKSMGVSDMEETP